MGLILLACAPAPAPAGESGGDAVVEVLPVYARASIDVRGVRPTVAELEALRADPASLDAQIEALLADPRLGWQAALLQAPTWQTRNDETDIVGTDLAMEDERTFLAAVGDEPLHILAEIVDHDLPWSDVVTAPWTVVNETLAAEWPVTWTDGATGWQRATWTDGRPAAGVLASTGLWRRYSSTYNNANRGRVNALSRILLCKDYLDQQVAFPPDLDLTDDEAVRAAIREEPACVSCHAALDPFGAYLWGFYSEFSSSPTDWAYYHPDRELNWEAFGVAPAYFGQPGYTLADLGRQMAQDRRLPTCLVQRTYEGLLQRPVTLADDAALARHREALLAGGATVRSLYRSILADPAYRALDGDDAPWKLASPDQLASMIADLTGYRFVVGSHDVFDTDLYALRSLAGGGRASGVYLPTPTATMVEVQERLAQAAAAWVAAGNGTLLAGIDPAATPDSDPEAMKTALVGLHLRILGEEADPEGEVVAAELALWEDLVAAGASPTAAWAGVVELLLRDPAFLVY